MAPRKRTAKEKEPKLSLAVALDFIKVAQSDKVGDIINKSHCRIAQGYAVASDNVITAGHPVEEDVNVCPQTFRLLDALKRCKKAVSITQLDAEQLVIKSGNFRAVIPCLNPAALPYSTPDLRAGTISDVIREGFEMLNPLVSGTGATTVEASLLLNNNSMIATDRTVMVEFWHGINLPDGLAIPKQAVTALCRIKQPLVGIGVSDRSVTFHYDNGAWFKTQLYAEPWPEVASIINGGDPYNTPDLPPAFFEAVEAVTGHSRDGGVYTKDGHLASHYSDAAGATYTLKGVPPGLCYGAKALLSIKDIATRFDFVGNGRGISYFFGDKARGAIVQRSS